MSGEDGEDESGMLREANLMMGEANLMMGEASIAQTMFAPGKPLLPPRHPVLTGGDGNLTGARDPTMLSPNSLRAYADRMQADYLRYR